MGQIDKFLNSVTMYGLVLYALLAMAALSVAFGFLGVLSYGGLRQLASLTAIVAACGATNALLARMRGVPANRESWAITALILFFLLTPVGKVADVGPALLAGTIAMASKYFIAPHGRHVFNPAALAAAALGILGIGDVSWWIGTPSLLPVTLLVGLLIVRKTRRFALFLACVAVSATFATILGLVHGIPPLQAFVEHFVSWPIVFFASVMVTEPLTLPPRRWQQVLYGATVGVLSGWPLVLGSVYMTPEIALCLANLGAYAVSLRRRLPLVLKEKTLVARDTWEYVFSVDPPLRFLAGQYLEWTLPHPHPDDRGVRRYFTVASSPTESDVRLGVKIGEKHSSYKVRLKAMEPGDTLLAGQLSGDFVLPHDPREKLVFIAGGIGITPFRSMIKCMTDRKEARDVVLFYANRAPEDVAYGDVLSEAERAIDLRVVHVFRDVKPGPGMPIGAITGVDPSSIRAHVPDWENRMYYLSGPSAMVDAFVVMLKTMGVPRRRIRTDYFPGFA